MGCQYCCPKKAFRANDVSMAQVFFANGDFFTLSKKEIVELDVQFYDILCAGERGFCPVASGGHIKCKIRDGKKWKGEMLLYCNASYGENLETYLVRRCVEEGQIRYVRLFDQWNWSFSFYCNADAASQGEYLILQFQEREGYGTTGAKMHTVNARDLAKGTVEKIYLDFENCDGMELFSEEIQEMEIQFAPELEWNASCFGRQVQKGLLRLKFDKEITWRRASVHCGRKKNVIQNLEKRLCGKKRAEIDVCHLYVSYRYAGYGLRYEECIDVKDVRSVKVQEKEDNYVSGYAERQEDGSILIVFGERGDK